MAYTPKNINGQATMANSEPVVIASDQSQIPVYDATVEGELQSLNPYVMNASYIMSAEDSASANGGSGAGILAVRQDTPANTSDTDGDFEYVKMSGGRLWTSAVVTSLPALPAGTNNIGDVDVLTLPNQYTEDVAAPADPIGNAIMYVRHDAANGVTSVDGDWLALRGDNKGGIYVKDMDSFGVLSGLLAATVTEDTASVTGDRGNPILAIRKATPADLSSTDGDYEFLQMSAGRLWVSGTITSLPSLPAGTNNIGDVDVLTLPAIPTGANTIGSIASITTSVVPGTGATNLGKAEDAVHASGDTGIFNLAVRADTAASSGANGDYVAMIADSVGALWTRDTTTLVDDSAFTVATSRVMPAGLMADETSTDSVDEGDVGIPRMTLDRKQIVSINPHTQGGLSTFHLMSAASTNATNIKASRGQVFGWYIYNSNAAARKIAFHNTAGSPTAGAGVVFSIVIPPTSGANVEFTNGIEFATGIAITTVTGLADADTAAVAANDLTINIFWK